MMVAKISIVTICYNAEKDIEKTIVSVMEQTYKNIEYIIKDGGSADRTLEKIYKLKQEYKDRNIKVISSTDRGIYDAMNQSLKYCSGEWVAFMNAGDTYSTSNIIENIFKVLNQRADVIYGDALVQDISGSGIWKGNIMQIDRKMPFAHETCFIRKHIIDKYNFDISYKIAADYNLIFDIYSAGFKFEKKNNIIAVFDMGGISSTKYVENIKERNLVRKKHGIAYSKKEEILDYAMAYIKECVKLILPMNIQIYVRKWYMRVIKKYESTMSEIKRDRLIE